MTTIESELRKDWEFLTKAKLHSIISKAYSYAAMLGKGDSFFVSLTDSVAPATARKYVGTTLRNTLAEELKSLDFVKEVKFTTEDLVEVILK